MSLSNTAEQHTTAQPVRFDDHTDLAALGWQTEAHDWRLPANLPEKPKGLALIAQRSAVEWMAQELPILQYQPDWRVWIVPIFAFTLMLSCLGLISFRLSMSSTALIVLGAGLMLVLAYSAYRLRQQRLIIDRDGIVYATDRTPRPTAQIQWADLVGVASERCFAGRTLIVMSRHGVDHSIRIAYLPDQKADQLTRLLRTQLTRRSHA